MWNNANSDHADTLADLVRCGGRFATATVATAEDSREHALMRAVLQEAILDIRGAPTAISYRERQQVAESARAWMTSRDLTWPFSFENVCAVLGLDADALLCRMLRTASRGEPAVAVDPSEPVPEATAIRWARRVRMRGNQQRGPLRPRRTRARAARLRNRHGER